MAVAAREPGVGFQQGDVKTKPKNSEANVIRSISSSQIKLLNGIQELHCPWGYELDTTYGKGRFYVMRYKKELVPTGIAIPRYCFDWTPQFDFVKKADYTSIELEDGAVMSAVFDPPFIHAHGKDSVIGNRFKSYPSQAALHESYRMAINEHFRVLNFGGVFVFKCQAQIESSKKIMSNWIIGARAIQAGFEVLEESILSTAHRMIGHNHGVQQHMRSYHSYFLAFKKPWPKGRRRQ